ncbi:hypothetical protein LCGC14_2324200, partial [marine sediment metagenome]
SKSKSYGLELLVEIQEDLAKEAFGDVLVAGYGLGIIQKLLIENPKVNSVTTVEKTMEVIKACTHTFGVLYGQVICMDFYDFIPSIAKVSHIESYDCVIGYIWPEISSKYVLEYIRFKNHAQILLSNHGKILAWGSEFYEYILDKQKALI